MKNSLLIGVVIASLLSSQQATFAQSPTIVNRIEARVGEFWLNASGFASQNASINIKTDNLLMGSTTAKPDGAFAFEKLPIKKGLTSICFDTVDIARIGKSTSCMQISPASGDINLEDIYLAPTIGLEKSSITEGGSGLAYGYTMPNASINIKMNNGANLSTKSNQSGKYSYTVGNLPVGTYDLASLGTYQGNKSLEPTSSVRLEVLVSSTSFTNQAVGLRRSLYNWLPWILLALLLSGVVGFLLIKKYRPQWLAIVTRSRAYRWVLRKLKRELHHAWFVGY